MANRWGTPDKGDLARAQAAEKAAKASALAQEKADRAAYIARWKGPKGNPNSN